MIPGILFVVVGLLPPPPSPADGPTVDTARVIGVVVLTLGLIAVASVALRPLVVRRASGTGSVSDVPPPAAPSGSEPPAPRTIIPFPVPPEPEPEWDDEVVTDRLHRVVGHPDRRRKLGSRGPERTPTSGPDREPSGGSRAADVPPEPRGTVIPLYDRLPHVQSAQGRHAGPPTDRPADRSAPSVAGPDELAATDVRPERRPDALPEPEAAATCDETVVTGAPAAEPGEPRPERPPEPAEDDGDRFASPHPADAAGRIDTDQDSALAGKDLTAGHAPLSLEIAAVIEKLVQCANEGRVLRGLTLYSDDHLFRFMDSTGLSDDAFREAFSRVQPRPADQWERLDKLDDFRVLPDGRVEVTVSYVDVTGRPANGIERYRMVYDANRRTWMIDDIVPLDQAE